MVFLQSNSNLKSKFAIGNYEVKTDFKTINLNFDISKPATIIDGLCCQWFFINSTAF